MEFSSQEQWSGSPFPFPGDLPHQGIKPRSPALQAISLSSEPNNLVIFHGKSYAKETDMNPIQKLFV